jgi:hypothetical protein
MIDGSNGKWWFGVMIGGIVGLIVMAFIFGVLL